MKKLLTLMMLAGVACLLPETAKATGGWENSACTIMLDPGHGGSDPGAGRSGYRYEADLVLDCCLEMNAWLNNVGSPHRMTRTGNYDVSLDARRSASITYDPWVFCSVHLNAFNGEAYGTETWYYWANRSPQLAQYVQNELHSRFNRSNRGIKQNGWTVITGASYIPAILTEGLFVDNIAENNMINSHSASHFGHWVNGHLEGFRKFMNSEGRGANITYAANYSTTGIVVSHSSVHFDCEKWAEPYQDITVTGTGLSENISVWSSDTNEFEVSPGTLGSGGGTVRVTLKNTGWAGNRSQKIYFKSGNIQVEVPVTASVSAPPMGSLEEGWNLSAQRGTQNSKGYDAAGIRNFTYLNGKLYCVYDHSRIIVLNAQTGDYLGDLKTGNVSGGTLKLCDVTNLSGKVLACNLAAGSENLKIYAWDSDEAEARVILETNDFQGCNRLGDCMEAVGTLDVDCWFAFGQDLGNQTRMVEYNYNRDRSENGGWYHKYTLAQKGDGSYLPTGATTRVYPNGSGWWIDGNRVSPCWTTWDDARGGATTKTCCDVGSQTQGASHHEFYFNGYKYAVNLVFRGSENYTGGKMRVLHDCTGNFSQVDQQQEVPWDGLGNDPNSNGTGDCQINTDGANYVEAWVLSTKQGLAYFKYGTPPAQNPGKVNAPELWFSEREPSARAKVGESVTKTIRIEGKNLKGGIDIVSHAGDQSGSWIANASVEVEPTHLDGPGEVRITYRPTDLAVTWIWMSARSQDAEWAWADFHAESYKDPTVTATGDTHFTARPEQQDTHTFAVHAENLKAELGYGLWGGNEDQFSLKGNWDLAETTTVYFDNNRAGWDQVNVWIWDLDNSEAQYLGCAWPGVAMTNVGGGRYAYSFNPSNTGARLGITFNNGDGRTITDDAYVLNGAVYSAAGRAADRVPGHRVPAIVNLDGELSVTYRPTWVGAPESNFYLYTPQKTPNTDVHLTATGLDYEQRLIPHTNDVDFGNVPVNVEATNNITLVAQHQRDDATLYIDGNNPDKFTLSHTTVKGDTQISVGYLPGEAGSHSATLHIVIPNEQDHQVYLRGWSDGTVGIDDVVATAMAITVHGGVLTVAGMDATHINIYNMAGALVSGHVDTNTVNISHLPAGNYIVAVTGADGMTHRVKAKF